MMEFSSTSRPYDRLCKLAEHLQEVEDTVQAENDRKKKRDLVMLSDEVRVIRKRMCEEWRVALREQLKECTRDKIMQQMWHRVFLSTFEVWRTQIKMCDAKLSHYNVLEHSQDTELRQTHERILKKRERIMRGYRQNLKEAQDFLSAIYHEHCALANMREEKLEDRDAEWIDASTVLMRDIDCDVHCWNNNRDSSSASSPKQPTSSPFDKPNAHHMSMLVVYYCLVFMGDCKRSFQESGECDAQGRSRPRNYNPARSLYMRAFMLVPSNGKAFVKLGALAHPADSQHRDVVAACYYWLYICTQQNADPTYRESARRNLQVLWATNKQSTARTLDNRGLHAISARHIADAENLDVFTVRFFGLIAEAKAAHNAAVVHENSNRFFELADKLITAVRAIFFPFVQNSSGGIKRRRTGHAKKARTPDFSYTTSEASPLHVARHLYRLLVICVCLLKELGFDKEEGVFYLRCVVSYMAFRLVRVALEVLLHDSVLHTLCPSSASSSDSYAVLLAPVAFFLAQFDDERDVLVDRLVKDLQEVKSGHFVCGEDTMEQRVENAGNKQMKTRSDVCDRLCRLLNSFAGQQWYDDISNVEQSSDRVCVALLPEQLLFHGGEIHGEHVTCKAFCLRSCSDPSAADALWADGKRNRHLEQRKDVEVEHVRFLWHRGVGGCGFLRRVAVLRRVLCCYATSQPAFVQTTLSDVDEKQSCVSFSCSFPSKWTDVLAHRDRRASEDMDGEEEESRRHQLDSSATQEEDHKGNSEVFVVPVVPDHLQYKFECSASGYSDPEYSLSTPPLNQKQHLATTVMNDPRQTRRCDSSNGNSVSMETLLSEFERLKAQVEWNNHINEQQQAKIDLLEQKVEQQQTKIDLLEAHVAQLNVLRKN